MPSDEAKRKKKKYNGDYYKADPEAQKDRVKLWRKENPKEYLAIQNKYRRKKRNIYNKYQRNYRERKKEEKEMLMALEGLRKMFGETIENNTK